MHCWLMAFGIVITGNCKISTINAHNRVLREARTIADLEGANRVHKPHIAEALCYRNIDFKVLV